MEPTYHYPTANTMPETIAQIRLHIAAIDGLLNAAKPDCNKAEGNIDDALSHLTDVLQCAEYACELEQAYQDAAEQAREEIHP